MDYIIQVAIIAIILGVLTWVFTSGEKPQIAVGVLLGIFALGMLAPSFGFSFTGETTEPVVTAAPGELDDYAFQVTEKTGITAIGTYIGASGTPGAAFIQFDTAYLESAKSFYATLYRTADTWTGGATGLYVELEVARSDDNGDTTNGARAVAYVEVPEFAATDGLTYSVIEKVNDDQGNFYVTGQFASETARNLDSTGKLVESYIVPGTPKTLKVSMYLWETGILKMIEHQPKIVKIKVCNGEGDVQATYLVQFTKIVYS